MRFEFLQEDFAHIGLDMQVEFVFIACAGGGSFEGDAVKGEPVIEPFAGGDAAGFDVFIARQLAKHFPQFFAHFATYWASHRPFFRLRMLPPVFDFFRFSGTYTPFFCLKHDS